MPTNATCAVSVDLSKLSGIDPGTTNLSNASVDFSPYAAYEVNAGEWLTRTILRTSLTDGVGTIALPPTPTGNAYEVQERGFRGARHGYVLVPDVATVDYVDLVWVDAATLDPITEPTAAWDVALSNEVLARTQGDATNASNLTAHEADHANPHAVTAAQVGLDQVDNTADADKPVSTATQSALNLKANQATTYTKTEVDGQQALDEKVANKGQANGYASLDGGGKVPITQLPSSIMQYQGTWNAATNTPTLADGSGDTGDVYRVSVAGTRNLGSGSITFDVGDYAIYNGTVWEKSDTTDAVASVAGKTGVVTLTKTDVGLGSVDNTSDGNKPVSVAQQAALNLKAPKLAPVFTAVTQSAPYNPATPEAPTGTSTPAVSYGVNGELRSSESNVATGYAAQRSLTTGSYNTATGYAAQYSLTTGSSNTATGYAAQYSLTTGTSNVATGYAAQYSLTTGTANVATGHYAQRSLTTGTANVATGHYAQYSLTTGTYNTATGYAAQYVPLGSVANATTTGKRQTSVGYGTGQSSATQVDDITTIGYYAVAGAAKATAIGSGARADHAGAVALGSDTLTTATAQVMIGPRDLEITDTTKGVIIKSPDGTRYRIKVANGGALSAVAA